MYRTYKLYVYVTGTSGTGTYESDESNRAQRPIILSQRRNLSEWKKDKDKRKLEPWHNFKLYNFVCYILELISQQNQNNKKCQMLMMTHRCIQLGTFISPTWWSLCHQ